MRKAMQDWAREIYATARAHGWHDGGERQPEVYACLIASELSEALEEARSGNPMVYGEDFEEDKRTGDMETIRTLGLKPEGIAVELIDAVIRVLDYAMATYGEAGPHADPEEWEEFGARPDAWEIGQLKGMPLEELIITAHVCVANAWTRRSSLLSVWPLEEMCRMIIWWLHTHSIDPEAVMELKHQYNKGRPYRHGGKQF